MLTEQVARLALRRFQIGRGEGQAPRGVASPAQCTILDDEDPSTGWRDLEPQSHAGLQTLGVPVESVAVAWFHGIDEVLRQLAASHATLETAVVIT